MLLTPVTNPLRFRDVIQDLRGLTSVAARPSRASSPLRPKKNSRPGTLGVLVGRLLGAFRKGFYGGSSGGCLEGVLAEVLEKSASNLSGKAPPGSVLGRASQRRLPGVYRERLPGKSPRRLSGKLQGSLGAVVENFLRGLLPGFSLEGLLGERRFRGRTAGWDASKVSGKAPWKVPQRTLPGVFLERFPGRALRDLLRSCGVSGVVVQNFLAWAFFWVQQRTLERLLGARLESIWQEIPAKPARTRALTSRTWLLFVQRPVFRSTSSLLSLIHI